MSSPPEMTVKYNNEKTWSGDHSWEQNYVVWTLVRSLQKIDLQDAIEKAMGMLRSEKVRSQNCNALNLDVDEKVSKLTKVADWIW